MANVKFVWHGPRVSREIKAAAAKGIDKGLNLVLKEINRLITKTPKTGKHYPRLPRRSSAPGEPPATQSGHHLEGFRKTNVSTRSGQVKGTITNTRKIADILEHGTPRMDPRPVFNEAMANKRAEIEELIAKEIRKVTAKKNRR